MCDIVVTCMAEPTTTGTGRVQMVRQIPGSYSGQSSGPQGMHHVLATINVLFIM